MDCHGVLWRKLNNINVMLISMGVYRGALSCAICSTVAVLGSGAALPSPALAPDRSQRAPLGFENGKCDND
jgi:hypothetical protein